MGAEETLVSLEAVDVSVGFRHGRKYSSPEDKRVYCINYVFPLRFSQCSQERGISNHNAWIGDEPCIDSIHDALNSVSPKARNKEPQGCTVSNSDADLSNHPSGITSRQS
jgi:hypothetical protein